MRGREPESQGGESEQGSRGEESEPENRGVKLRAEWLKHWIGGETPDVLSKLALRKIKSVLSDVALRYYGIRLSYSEVF